MVVPQWISPYLNSQELLEIEKTIAEIELKTEAEIVPVIVRSSSHYQQTRVTLTLIAALLFLIIWDWCVPHLYWDYWYSTAVLLFFGLGFIFLAMPWLARHDCVRRWMTVRSEEMEQCWKRAKIEFYENCLHHTEQSVGLLIYVSMLEHVVIVMADKKISDKLPAATWQNMVDHMVFGLKNKKMAEGFKKGLAECSSLLIEHFPVKIGDVNELSNHVVVKE
jgi:putative membrane protein